MKIKIEGFHSIILKFLKQHFRLSWKLILSSFIFAQKIEEHHKVEVAQQVTEVWVKSIMQNCLANVRDYDFLLFHFLCPKYRDRASNLYVGKNKVLGGVLDYHLSLYEVSGVSFFIHASSIKSGPTHLEPSPWNKN